MIAERCRPLKKGRRARLSAERFDGSELHRATIAENFIIGFQTLQLAMSSSVVSFGFVSLFSG